MRAVLVGVAAAVLVAALGGSADGRQPEKIDAKLLIGKWTPKEVKGEDFVMQFTKDGKLVFVGKAGDKEFTLEGTYKLEGNKLNFKMAFGGIEKEETRTVNSLSKTELVSSDAKGKKDTLVRVAAKGEK
ncbi:MAG TPA: TIGR03066 family protein [Urbifossiella sp.]|nr:TIGR03066 family protein [Urbifossiella sp.]